MSGRDALIVMGKAPIPGKVKTRLSPRLSPASAAALYACFLADTARETARLAEVEKYLYYDPPEGRAHFDGAPFRGFRLLPQGGGDIGDRMARAIRAAKERGAPRVVVVGADCPALGAARVREAFRELRAGAGAVLGPTFDGGFYLIGLAGGHPPPFDGVAWSTGAVLRRVLENCRGRGTAFTLLASGFDVDTPEDLERLVAWAASHRRPACPATRAWLSRALPAVSARPAGGCARRG